jgi:exonuclease VII small subunit
MKELSIMMICITLTATMARANESLEVPPGANIWADDVLSQNFVTNLTDSECDSLKEELRFELASRYAGKASAMSLQHAADTIATLCSIVRLSQETERLEAIIVQLEDSIARLETSMIRLEASVDRLSVLAQSAPLSDRAQHEADIAQNRLDITLNRADIAAIRTGIAQSRRSIAAIDATLNGPDNGLVALFHAARELAVEEDEAIIAALDPKAQQEWLRRLIGGGPTQT